MKNAKEFLLILWRESPTPFGDYQRLLKTTPQALSSTGLGTTKMPDRVPAPGALSGGKVTQHTGSNTNTKYKYDTIRYNTTQIQYKHKCKYKIQIQYNTNTKYKYNTVLTKYKYNTNANTNTNTKYKHKI